MVYTALSTVVSSQYMVAMTAIIIHQHKAGRHSENKPVSHLFLILELIKLDTRFKTQKQHLKVGIYNFDHEVML